MPAEPDPPPRQAGVVGSPIQHSLSPLLHRAAYRALGLRHWSYHREEVPAGGLEAFVDSLPATWVGLSVTMPGKEEALALATEATQRAQLTGAANTLVAGPRGWWADNTDIDGIVGALADVGCHRVESAWVLGSGATCRSVLLALHGLGLRRVTLQVRTTPRPATLALAESLGVEAVVRAGDEGAAPSGSFEVAVSTVPAGVAMPVPAWPERPPPTRAARPFWVLDVAYHVESEWALRAVAAGAVRASGTEMLVRQAAQQVQLMTGHEAPLGAMRAALGGGRDQHDP